jgi:hypothetical protein
MQRIDKTKLIFAFRYFANAPRKRILESEAVASNASDYGRGLAFVKTLPDQLDKRQFLKENISSQNCLALCSFIPVGSSNNLHGIIN